MYDGMLALALQDISQVPFSLWDVMRCGLSMVCLSSQPDVCALPEL